MSPSPSSPNNQTDPWWPRQSGWARLLERITLVLERPINKLTSTSQLNPFYHTGTIAVFLLIVVGATGFYLFLFFQYGFEASYNSVDRIEGQIIARFVRALHRYASGAAVITTLLHAWRILFMERFRGPRWLAWLTGIVMTVLLWLAGVTGYWLIWDERAGLITDVFTRFLARYTSWAPTFVTGLFSMGQRGQSWRVLGIILAIHVVLFLLVAGFFWLHVVRLQRAKWMPTAVWAAGMSVVLILGSALFPVGMLPAIEPTQLPASITIDPIFLFYLPVTGTPIAAWVWAGGAAAVLCLTALPWLRLRQRPSPPLVRILDDNCTGCTRCALDCPYGAISIVERPTEHQHKYLAVAHPELCVSCGICVGSCDDFAITLGDAQPDALWQMADQRLQEAQTQNGSVKIVFTCERHANQSGRPFLNNGHLESTKVIPVPCVGAIPPDLLIKTLDDGATEVRVVGCPPDDCANREGNMWMEQRITQQRAPRLKRAYAQVPITAVWLPPDSFPEAVTKQFDPEETNWRESRRIFELLTWKNWVPAFVALALVLLIQIVLTDVPFRPSLSSQAIIRVELADPLAPLARSLPANGKIGLEVDGKLVWEQVLATADFQQPIYSEQIIAPGEHNIHLYIVADDIPTTLFADTTQLTAGQIIRLDYAKEGDKSRKFVKQ